MSGSIQEKYQSIKYWNGDSPEDTQGFIDEICGELRNGFGFVPLIGAGFSAPSGAPLIFEILEYLQRCICISLGIDDDEYQKNTIEPWNPRTDQWPPFIDRSRIFHRGHWNDLLFNKIVHLRTLDPGKRWEANLSLLCEGFGAMQEWRTALLFLSRLNRPAREQAGAKNPRAVWLGVPQQEVIDACFREVLKDKFPALGHRMLAALAGAMRLDIILTTNFDDLLEQAFEVARNPIEVFEVQMSGQLPDWSALSNVRALVKLHGGRSSLRADYSLDETPSEEDKQAFLRYLLSATGRKQFRDNPEGKEFDFQNHLLVVGFSATDRRIRALIEYAWKRLKTDFRVYWICYSMEDVDGIRKFIWDKGQKEDKASTTIIRHTQAGLLLLQLYQNLRKTLPPLGSIFPSVSRMTLPPLESKRIAERFAEEPRADAVKKFIDKVQTAVNGFDNDKGDKHKVVLATASMSTSGLLTVCSRAFRALDKDKVCLWIDMNDISSADNLFEVLLEAIYYRLGSEDWIPSAVGDEVNSSARAAYEDRRGAEIDRLARSSTKQWVVFLNACETPGANTDEGQESGGGWLDKYQISPDRKLFYDDISACRKSLINLLRVLCDSNSRVTVVMINRNRDFFSLCEYKERIDPVPCVWEDVLEDPKPWFVEKTIVRAALNWTCDKPGEEVARRRFLHALVLMQRPRHLATLWSPALSHASLSDDGIQLQWIRELEDIDLVRRKPGGMIWLHSPCRQSIRKILAGNKNALENYAKPSDPDRKRIEKIVTDWNPVKDEAEIHKDIAEWYEKVLDASEAPPAAFEAAFHFCHSGLSFLKGEESQPNYDHYRRAVANIHAATALLRANSFLIQTHGYSRGSCRRLESIASIGSKIFVEAKSKVQKESVVDEQTKQTIETDHSSLIQKAVRDLWIVCVEIMRAIAREVGEDAKAYYRLRQIGKLTIGKTWEQTWEERKEDQEEQPEAAPPKPRGEISDAVKKAFDNAAWLRWQRWSGMLAIASRSYHQAQKVFEPEVGKFSEQKNYKDDKGMRKPLGNQSERIGTLRLIEQSVELLLLKRSLMLRLLDIDSKYRIVENYKKLAPTEQEKEFLLGVSDTDKEMNDLLAQGAAMFLSEANAMVSRGVNLARKVRDEDESMDAHQVSQANWCEVRLLMHKSVIMRQPLMSATLPAERLESLGILGDAEAKLRISDSRRTRSELAMLDLHRADAKLREAECVELHGAAENPICLPALISGCSPLIYSSRMELKADDVLCFLHKDLNLNINNKDSIAEKLAQASSSVGDSIRFLNRAEPVLRDRRRNVWWTTWFFERKLRAIALSVAASSFDSGTPIPFLGLEAAMRATETEADRLLTDAIRMIRVDAYRLASITDAYLSCIKALNMRVALDHQFWKPQPNKEDEEKPEVALPRRRAQMLMNLRNARIALEAVDKRRQPNNINILYKEQGRVSAAVQLYVDAIKQKTDTFLEDNKEPVAERDRHIVT